MSTQVNTKRKFKPVADLDPELWGWAKSQAALRGCRIGVWLNTVIGMHRALTNIENTPKEIEYLLTPTAAASTTLPASKVLRGDKAFNPDLKADPALQKTLKAMKKSLMKELDKVATQETDLFYEGTVVDPTTAPLNTRDWYESYCGKPLSMTVGHVCRLPKDHPGRCPKK